MYPGRYAIDHPDRPAIIMAGTGETIRFHTYEERCNRFAHLLRAQGLRTGDHIALFMENHPRMLEVEGAAERVHPRPSDEHRPRAERERLHHVETGGGAASV